MFNWTGFDEMKSLLETTEETAYFTGFGKLDRTFYMTKLSQKL